MAGMSRTESDGAAERYPVRVSATDAQSFTQARSNALAESSKRIRADLPKCANIAVNGTDHAITRLGLGAGLVDR
jgi:hypothetical protein